MQAKQTQAKVRATECALGTQYIHPRGTIVFPFGASPLLAWGKSLTRIDSPERFGSWGNKKERMAYVQTFFAS